MLMLRWARRCGFAVWLLAALASNALAQVVLPVPAYMPFFEVGPAADREIAHVPTLPDGPDPAAVEKAFADGAGSLILCNPNNPLGFTFTAERLRELADIAAKYDARIISD